MRVPEVDQVCLVRLIIIYYTLSCRRLSLRASSDVSCSSTGSSLADSVQRCLFSVKSVDLMSMAVFWKARLSRADVQCSHVPLYASLPACSRTRVVTVVHAMSQKQDLPPSMKSPDEPGRVNFCGCVRIFVRGHHNLSVISEDMHQQADVGSG